MPGTSGWSAAPQWRPPREDIASTVIQGTAAAASGAGFVHLLLGTGLPQGGRALAAIIAYGASMFIAFLASAIYHGVQHGRAKAVLQKIDHCAIFLFIAGTYTPVALLPLWDHRGGILLAAIWILAVVGIALRLMNGSLFRRIAVPLYLAMGWLCFGWGVPLYRSVGAAPIALMVAGGLCYTGGLVFHRWHRVPFSNPLWHVCVVAGSAFFFLAITRFLPA